MTLRPYTRSPKAARSSLAPLASLIFTKSCIADVFWGLKSRTLRLPFIEKLAGWLAGWLALLYEEGPHEAVRGCCLPLLESSDTAAWLPPSGAARLRAMAIHVFSRLLSRKMQGQRRVPL